MKLPNEFEYYLQKGIIRQITPDKPRAKFLINGSKVLLQSLKERIDILGISDTNANSIIKDCYDFMMELIRSKLLLAGYCSSGNCAHEGEISYLKKFGFSDVELSFLNELRVFRNGIIYYGKILDKEYATKVYDFLNKFKEKIRPPCIIIRGPLGIGKSTIAKALAKEFDADYFSIDSILEQEGLDPIDQKQGCIPLSNFIKANEKILPRIKEATEGLKSVIIDGNFYHKEQLDSLISSLTGIKVHVFTLKASLQTCITRDKERQNSYGPEAAKAVYSLVSKLTYGIIIDTENKAEKEVVDEIQKKLRC